MKKLIDLNDSFAVESLLSKINYVVCDLDGVVWNGDVAVPGAPEALNALKSCGKRVIYATNNGGKSRKNIQDKLRKFGVEADLNDIMVSGFAAALYLNEHNFDGTVYLMEKNNGWQHELEMAGIKVKCFEDHEIKSKDLSFANLDLDKDVKAVIVSLDDQITFPKFTIASNYAKIASDKFFLCSNWDPTYEHSNSNIIVPGTGSFVAFVENVVSKKSVIIGKPSTFFFKYIKKVHPKLDGSSCLMIGDQLSDVQFAFNCGIEYSMLCLSGHSTVETLLDLQSGIITEMSKIPTHYCTSLDVFRKYI